MTLAVGALGTGDRTATALLQRMRAAAEVLAPHAPVPLPGGTDTEQAGVALDLLVHEVHRSRSVAAMWLLFTAVAASFPTTDELLSLRRTVDLTTPDETVVHLLEACYRSTRNGGSPHLTMDVVRDQVVVDVDFCARSEHHTGIQRVVREVMPRWTRDHPLLLVAWTDAHGTMRYLDEDEQGRVLRWGQHRAPDTSGARTTDRILVPWNCRVVLPENPEPQRCPSLAALARFSGNYVSAIGYDCIPVVSPELIHPGLPDRFMRYLSVIKHVDRVAGISSSATAEFRGFARMVHAQGLPGPRVCEVMLPVEVPPAAAGAGTHGDDQPPLVLSVGSFEPRKNQLALLEAAERLWRRGLRFRLHFVGGGGWRTEFEPLMNRLAAAGRPVKVSVRIDDEELWALYRRARFSVFTSLHEGYGLPLAESLACGLPALTTSYGSTEELARDGGALLVDPRDGDALTAALSRMLTDDGLIARLAEQARSRRPRTWDDYSRELWTAIVPDATR